MKKILIASLLIGNFLHLNAQADAFSDCVHSGMRWDDRTNTCFSGRLWGDHAPKEFASLLDREFAPEWKNEVRKKFNIDLENPKTCHNETPLAVVIFGSAGSGKSTIQKYLGTRGIGNKRFDLNEFVLFDGDTIRESNPHFKQYMGQFDFGYRNVMALMKKHVHQVKNELLDEVANNRCNIVISTVAKMTSSTETAYISQLEAKGYHFEYYFVYVPYEVTVPRAKNRAEWTGRAFDGTSEQWKSQIRFAQHITKLGNVPITLIDNSIFDQPRIMDVSELEVLAQSAQNPKTQDAGSSSNSND